MIECVIGCNKQHSILRKTGHRDIRRVAIDFLLKLITRSVVCISKLVSA